MKTGGLNKKMIRYELPSKLLCLARLVFLVTLLLKCIRRAKIVRSTHKSESLPSKSIASPDSNIPKLIAPPNSITMDLKVSEEQKTVHEVIPNISSYGI